MCNAQVQPADSTPYNPVFYARSTLRNIADGLQRHLDWHYEDMLLRTGQLVVGPHIWEDLQFLAVRNALDQSMKLYALMSLRTPL